MTVPITLYLRDLDQDVVDAWLVHFRQVPGVHVSQGNILDLEADALVSPANSFGFMDGGIELAYSQRFGWTLQERLQDELLAHHDGELPVGQAVVIDTYDGRLPRLISAPTMRIPSEIQGTVHAYLAFRAALRAVKLYNASAAEPIRSLASPGLGTAIGRLPPAVCAQQMFAAYAVVLLRMENRPLNLGQAVAEHHRLTGP